MTIHYQPIRRGLASIWVVVVLAVLTIVLTTVAAQLILNRRAQERRAQLAQCMWLARAGIELAADRLLTDPAGYQGEKLDLVPNGAVRIEVKPEKDEPNTYLVTSEARFPADERRPIAQMVSRRFRRVVEKGEVRLEVPAPKPAAKP